MARQAGCWWRRASSPRRAGPGSSPGSSSSSMISWCVQCRYYLHIYLHQQTRYLQTIYVQVYGTILVRGHKYTRQHVLPLHELSVRLLAEGEGEVTTRVNTCHMSRVTCQHCRWTTAGWSTPGPRASPCTPPPARRNKAG